MSLKKGAVTFLDVLGWKGIWKRDDRALEKLYNLIEHIGKNIKDLLEEAHRGVSEQDAYLKDIEVKLLSISDTIVITTYGESKSALHFQSVAVAGTMSYAFSIGLPIRGATSYGEFDNRGNILIGPAVDEVASWYELAEWIGVFLTPSALYQYDGNAPLSMLYDVPLKIGKLKTYCSSWFDIDEDDKLENMEDKIRKFFLEFSPITPDISNKFYNTLEFISYYKKNHIK